MSVALFVVYGLLGCIVINASLAIIRLDWQSGANFVSDLPTLPIAIVLGRGNWKR